MNKDTEMICCCQCAGHFMLSQMHKLKIENVPVDLYICNTCLDNRPRLSENTESPLKKV